MSKNISSARAPNKRSLVKLGAIVAAAMLGVGAISLFDTASAYDGYEIYMPDGEPVTTTTVTDSNDPGAEPPLPPDYEYPAFKWSYTDSVEGTRTVPQRSERQHEAPDAVLPDGSPDGTTATEWQPGSPVHYGRVDGQWVRLREYRLTGNWQHLEAPTRDVGDTGGPAGNVGWNETGGGLSSHALAAAQQGLIDQTEVIYTTSDPGQGNWFMVDAGGGKVTELGTSYVWTRDLIFPEWTHTWTLKQMVEETAEDVMVNCEVCGESVDSDHTCYVDEEPGIGQGRGVWVQQEWTGGPSVEMPAFEAGGWHTPAGQVDRVPNIPEGHQEGVPFHGQGRGSWKRWVRIDGDAWNDSRPNARVIVVLTQDPGY